MQEQVFAKIHFAHAARADEIQHLVLFRQEKSIRSTASVDGREMRSIVVHGPSAPQRMSAIRYRFSHYIPEEGWQYLRGAASRWRTGVVLEIGDGLRCGHIRNTPQKNKRFVEMRVEDYAIMSRLRACENFEEG